jgi:hypothetical protein
MPTVEFIYDLDCPNVADARANLKHALDQTGLPPAWQEWERADPNAPAHARRYGSPTVLVNGKDVAGMLPSDAPSCRIYSEGQGRNRGVPSVELMATAIRGAIHIRKEKPAGGLGTQGVSLLPAIGVALLPKLTCPACWPAYAALLSALGVGFIDYTPYLLPLTLVFLVVTLAVLAWRPHRGYAPLALGLAASAIVLVGKFSFDSEAAVYSGVALLVVASGWNAWPAPRAACPACEAGTNNAH